MSFWRSRYVVVYGFPVQGAGSANRLVTGTIDASQPLQEIALLNSKTGRFTSTTLRFVIHGDSAYQLQGISGGPIYDVQSGTVIGVEHAYDFVQNQVALIENARKQVVVVRDQETRLVYGTPLNFVQALWPEFAAECHAEWLASRPRVRSSSGAIQPGGSPTADRYRANMLARVRNDWIDGEHGVLKESLFRNVRILLGLSERPDAVMPLNLHVRTHEQAEQPVPQGTRVVDVFDRLGKTLLILGKPGSGKTILLLELTEELLNRATVDPNHPIPVVFPLSTWAESRWPFKKWLVEELNRVYGVPRKIAIDWVEGDQIMPLLDGLDEVKAEQRPACINAINNFRKNHGLLPLVVSSRTDDYGIVIEDASRLPAANGPLSEEKGDLPVPSGPGVRIVTPKLRVDGAIVVQPLTREQVLSYLKNLGPAGAHIRRELEEERRQLDQDGRPLGEDQTLWGLLDTPLMLSIVVLAYGDDSDQSPPRGGTLWVTIGEGTTGTANWAPGSNRWVAMTWCPRT
jgi:hypothetical protein